MTDSTPTGYRWATITPDDKTGTLYIVVFLAFIYSNLTFITRGFIKWHILGLDDAAMCLAQVASIIQFALILVSLSAGLGKTFNLLSDDEYASMASSQHGNQIALYISLGLSKLATILLIQRLFTRDMKKAWMTCNVVIAAVAIWTIAVVFLVAVGCPPKSMMPKEASQTCSSLVGRYQSIVITDAMTDAFLVITPTYLCWQLQMSISLKFQVLAIFAFRLPVVALAVLFLKAWTRSLSSDNPGVDRTPAIIYQQSELCLSLIAGTIPCLKSFIRSFDTGSGVKVSVRSTNGYGDGRHTTSNTRNHSQNYELSSLNRSTNRASREAPRSRISLHESKRRISKDLRSFTSGRSNLFEIEGRQNLEENNIDWLEEGLDRESQGESQGSTRRLFIRKELRWEVGSDVRRASDTPGMLRLPQ